MRGFGRQGVAFPTIGDATMSEMRSIPIGRTHHSTKPEGMSLSEIADEMGITQDAVRGILYKAMQKLRKKVVRLGIKREDYLQ